MTHILSTNKPIKPIFTLATYLFQLWVWVLQYHLIQSYNVKRCDLYALAALLHRLMKFNLSALVVW